MKTKSKVATAIVNLFKRYWEVLAVIAVSIVALFTLPSLQSLAMGVMYVTCGLFAALIVRQLIHTTDDRYIDSDQYSKDFLSDNWKALFRVAIVRLTFLVYFVTCVYVFSK